MASLLLLNYYSFLPSFRDLPFQKFFSSRLAYRYSRIHTHGERKEKEELPNKVYTVITKATSLLTRWSRGD
jgi:hypothetical protein